MAKFAYVTTKWIGKGTQNDPRRPDIPEGYTSCADVTGAMQGGLQLDKNVVVVLVEESRQKHKGYIDKLKKKRNLVVLEEWESIEVPGPPGVALRAMPTPVRRVATPKKLKNFLRKQGVSDVLADEVANTIPDVSIAKKLIGVAKGFDRKK